MPPWMRVESPAHIEFLDTLDIGEASAISLARQRNADLRLVDERAGTRVAPTDGIRAVGTLGVLIDGGLENLLDFDAAIDRLIAQTPFRASASLIEAAHRIFNERRTQHRP
jgi:predicted nucleic acid-binding protein